MSGSDSLQLVLFSLDGREYALGIDSVSEIIRMVALSPVPEAPPWMAGVVNLRGTVVPVVDLGERLGLGRRTPTLRTPIVIATIGERLVGLIVDEVLDVVSVPGDAVRPPDDTAGTGHAVGAVARVDERLVMVIDLERARLVSDMPSTEETQVGSVPGRA